MATVGFATLDVIPSVRGLRAQLDKQVNPGLAAAGRKGGKQFGDAAGTTAAQGFSSKLQSGLNGVGGKLFAGLGLAAAGKAIIGLQADFESSINVLGASADLTSAQMQQMAKFAKQMGAETVFSAGEAADAMVELAKAGLEPATIKSGALKATMAVAATEGLKLADAATIISNTMTTFGIEGAKAVTVADALAGGSKASTASVSSLAEAMSQVGGSAVDAGLSLQETVAALSAFDQEGIKGSDAGTSLKTMLSRLVPQTEKASGAMEDLGLNFTDANGSFLPLANIAGQLQDKLSGLSDAERTTALNTIFGSDARRAAIALMHQGEQGIKDFTKATSEAGTAQKLANARMSGTAGAIEKLKGSVETAGLAFGEVLAPGVVVAANGLSTLADAVGGLPAPVQAATLAFVGLKVASAFGVSGPTANMGTLSRALDGVRLRAMLAADEFRTARSSTLQIEGAYGKLTPGVGRLSASMRGLSAATAGASGALKRGLGGLSNLVGGPLGAAFIVGTAALVKFKQAQAEAKARADELTASYDQQTGAVTEGTRALAAKDLQSKGALDAAERLGIQSSLITDAVLGNAKAQRELNDALSGFATDNTITSAKDLRQSYSEQEIQTILANRAATNLRDTVSSLSPEYAKTGSAAEQLARAVQKSGDKSAEASTTAQTGMRNYRGEVDRAKSAIDSLIASEDERAKRAILRERDEIALREAIRATREELKKGKKVLDDGSKAADDNMTALLNLADQWNKSKPAVRNAKGAYAEIREEFINNADAMGKTRAEAVKLADKYLTIPKTAPLKFQSEGYKERVAEIDALKERVHGLRHERRAPGSNKPVAPGLALNLGFVSSGYRERMAEIRELRKQARDIGVTIHYPGIGKAVAPALERASGGAVFGAGTSTSDSIPAWLSNGEFVQRTRAVNYYGLDFMKRLNNLQIPKFANGGPVAAAPSSSSGGGPGLVIDQRGATFQVADYRDFMQQTQRRAEASNLSGVRS